MRAAVIVPFLLCFACPTQDLSAAARGTPDYVVAQSEFMTRFSLDQRLLIQTLLIAGGYSNAVPVERFSALTFKGIEKFQAQNGFPVDGLLNAEELQRLAAIGQPMLDMWGFEKISHPFRPVTLWVPTGLGLTMFANGSGLHYRDPQNRLSVDFVSVANRALPAVYRERVAGLGPDATVHYYAFKDDWFVLSVTTTDGHDHYYRYHQDLSYVTGFALEWDNRAGNVNGERIAVLMSASLGSAMGGPPLIDPPQRAQVAETAPQPQPAAVPVAPPPPPPQSGLKISTGTGFFVSEDGAFITNAHVVGDCTKILVKLDDGSIKPAERQALDATNDLALLKLDLRPKQWAKIRVGVRLGEAVEAFGFPHSNVLSSSGNFTLGNVTALDGIRDDSRFLQISAPVQAGNSGGPLIDDKGNVIGVVTSKLNALNVAFNDGDLTQNVNFAVKSSMVIAFLDANRVRYTLAGGAGPRLDAPDLADAARAISGFVACQ
jgi:S1-C subfamily serine protease